MIVTPKLKTVYLSGPMTGIPKLNFPLFEEAAQQLRDEGYYVISPNENHPDNIEEIQKQECVRCGTAYFYETPMYALFMHRDILDVLMCDEIAMLPGWFESRGSRFEWEVARMTGKGVLELAGVEGYEWLRQG